MVALNAAPKDCCVFWLQSHSLMTICLVPLAALTLLHGFEASVELMTSLIQACKTERHVVSQPVIVSVATAFFMPSTLPVHHCNCKSVCVTVQQLK